MREDVKQKHCSTPLRETSIGACIQAPSLRGEAFGSNAWSGHRVRQGYGSQLLVSLEWLHAAVPTPFVAKLRKPTVGLSANHHPMGGSRPMAFLGYPRHLSKFVKSLFSALTMRSTEYPQRFHNVFP